MLEMILEFVMLVLFFVVPVAVYTIIQGWPGIKSKWKENRRTEVRKILIGSSEFNVYIQTRTVNSSDDKVHFYSSFTIQSKYRFGKLMRLTIRPTDFHKGETPYKYEWITPRKDTFDIRSLDILFFDCTARRITNWQNKLKVSTPIEAYFVSFNVHSSSIAILFSKSHPIPILQIY